MAGFSRFLQQEVLDHLLDVGAYSAPTIYVGLFTAAPSDTGGGTEVTGGSYVREAHPDWNAATAASPSVSTNDGAVSFTTATAAWGTVTHFGLFDAESAGNLLGWAALTAEKIVGDGDTAEFADTVLNVTLD